MKKTLLIACLLASAGMFASCIKGDDLEMLKHPVHVRGSFEPAFGFPVGNGEAQMNDILARLDSAISGNIEQDSNIITLKYAMETKDSLNLSGMTKKSAYCQSKRGNVTKESGFITVADTIFSSAVSLDIFNTSSFQQLDSIQISHVWMDLDVGIKAIFDDPTLQNNVKISFTNMQIFYRPKGSNVMSQFVDPAMTFDTLDLEDIVAGTPMSFRKVDVAEIINSKPTKLEVRFQLILQVNAQWIADNLDMDEDDFTDNLTTTLNNLNASKFIYGINLKVQMPLSMRINNWSYDFKLNMGDGLSSLNIDSIAQSISSGIHADIGQDSLILKLDNGIPLTMKLDAVLLDSKDHPYDTLFRNQSIVAAPTRPVPGDAIMQEAAGTTQSFIRVMLNNEQLESLKTCKKLLLVLNLDSEGKFVAIKKDDKLAIKAYLKVMPMLDVDISILDRGILRR